MSQPIGEFEYDEYQPTRTAVVANSVIWPSMVDGGKSHKLVQGVLKGRGICRCSAIPLFCFYLTGS